jgi:hypothetical protein
MNGSEIFLEFIIDKEERKELKLSGMKHKKSELKLSGTTGKQNQN